MDQRRIWLAVGLSLLLLLAYQEFVVRPYQQKAQEATSQESPPALPGAAAEPSAARPEVPPATTPSDLAAPAGGRTITVETDLVTATITTQGGRLESLRLKRFRRSVGPDSPDLNLVESGAAVLPLTLQLGASATDAGIAYEADRDRLTLTGNADGAVTLTGRRPDGSTITKRLGFKGDSYLFSLNASVRDGAVGLVLAPVASEGAQGGQHSGVESAIALDASNRRVTEHAVKDLSGDAVTIPEALWAGFSAQYFAALAMPMQGAAKIVMGKSGDVPVVRVDVPVADGAAGFDLFFGPKDPKVLDGLAHDLDRVIDFGWFWFIAQPLLRLLELFQKLTGNYGVAIILLTALVKVVTIPLTQTSFRSMRAMQQLQPEMQRLRERHKDDQMELQKQMMELYKKNKVNPFAGCLPMILQMPIFIGLYQALNHAIELRHAPFMLWIDDLSAPDWLSVGGVHVPVLVILMGLSMLVQQRMTPQQGDPAQQRMMMVMPLVFTFMFINFPSGLVLYWLVNNVMTIAQQAVMLRRA